MTAFQRMSGNEYLSFNNSVFLAEREVSDRNFALSYYMKENKCFPKGSNIKDCLDFWYQVSLWSNLTWFQLGGLKDQLAYIV